MFAACLARVLTADTRHLNVDRELLAACAAFRRVATAHDRKASLRELAPGAAEVTIAAADADRLAEIYARTPQPKAVRVRGRLDSVSVSGPTGQLLLDDGSHVCFRGDALDIADLRDLLGADVAVSGMARFRPDNDLLYIDAAVFAASTEGDRVFSVRPTGRAELPAPVSADTEEKVGVAAFFGTWPGDESLDDLLHGLDQLR